MKKSINYFFKPVIILLAILIFKSNVYAQARDKADINTTQWRYEIECMGVGSEGTYLIKVYSYSKRPEVALEQAKKNAIHGVVFKGFSVGAQGCPAQKPLARNPNAESEHAEFFKSFFADGGKYMKFVGLTSDGNVDASDITKSGKEYKVGIIISVQKDLLRKDLEAAGVIRGLNSGF